MRNIIKISAAVVAAATLTLGATACSAPSDTSSSGNKKNDASSPLVVAASPTPHGAILNFVKDKLAEKEGLKLEVKELNDYTLPNQLTDKGEVGANFFQHKPFLDEFNKKNGTHIVPVVNVAIEPLGLYSKKLDKLSDLKPGDTVAVPNDPSNQGRALKLLADNGAITLKAGAGTTAKLADVEDKKGLKLTELEAPQIAPRLADVDAAVINGNFAIGAKLKPSEDALALEKADGNPYANFLAVKQGNEDDERVKKLAKLLNSDEVKKFIEDKYKDGSVIPAFGPVKS
ncbi:MetQ/NlpA family ABC transporter substrate-binding protein [Streptomyces albireticuli]|uniref:MetQ/NlpA family ABC transporter substrate-binding protein n=1 Tax=Streptomyces albireticuli TaxID=1940 RepID=UPI001474E104|nr:MetQ/NlpA family ABC transporter substrate-binding protein [Streptomyces albireticuli]MCD9143318.1 MetQ/NlpA family ABC transporter substrate-binding protein [Streptomyces albireticuli]MCD9163760.1 MetQ/NlpA family ABC transporter substrate-binding protein [Streptomyces albireticuli]MCD9191435.1 MetQ/NlpA family ABC transporter substrate-binding protein [Streptomyces albireticuli]